MMVGREFRLNDIKQGFCTNRDQEKESFGVPSRFHPWSISSSTTSHEFEPHARNRVYFKKQKQKF